MISINKKTFYTIIVILLISFSLFTVFYLEDVSPWTGKKSETITFETSHMGGDGYYNTRVITDFSPGTYQVTLSPIGENITILIRSHEETIEKNITDSEQEISFEIEVESAVWQGVLIEDAPEIDFTDGEEEVMMIEYEKIDDGLKNTTFILLGGGIGGGVIIGAKTSRAYHKERE